MERNYYSENQGQRRMQPNTDRYSRWSEDDDRMDRDERYARDRDDSEIDRFNKYTRNAPYSTYGSMNEGSERYRGQSYDLRDRDHRRDYSSQDYGRAPSQSYENSPYQNFGRSNSFSDRSDSSGYGRGGTYNYGGSPSGYSHQAQYGQGYGSDRSYERPYDRSQSFNSSSRYSRDFGPGYGSQQSYNTQGYNSNSYGPSSYGQSPGYASDYSRYGNESYGSRYDSSYNNAPYRGQDSFSGSYASDWGRGYQSSPWSQSDRAMSNRSGRAPKGYKRSDERIKEEVCDLLTNAPHIDPSDLEVKVSSGEVTLSGTVEDRSEKRMAEDLASTISGVTEVHNQLRVSSQNDKDRGWNSRSNSSSASGLTDTRSESAKSSPSSSKSVQ